MPILSVAELEGDLTPKRSKSKAKAKAKEPKYTFLWPDVDSTEPKRYNLSDPEEKAEHEADKASYYTAAEVKAARIRDAETGGDDAGPDWKDAFTDALASGGGSGDGRQHRRRRSGRSARGPGDALSRQSGRSAGRNTPAGRLGKVVGRVGKSAMSKAGRALGSPLGLSLATAAAIAGLAWWGEKRRDDQLRRKFIENEVWKREQYTQRRLPPNEMAVLMKTASAMYDAQMLKKRATSTTAPKTLR